MQLFALELAPLIIEKAEKLVFLATPHRTSSRESGMRFSQATPIAAAFAAPLAITFELVSPSEEVPIISRYIALAFFSSSLIFT